MKKYKIFLDTNFLIASQIKEHAFHERTKELRVHFAELGAQQYIYPLVLDEFWYVLSGIWKQKYSKLTPKHYEMLKKATNNVYNFENLSVLETMLHESEMLDTVSLMQKYKLRPRDAMIIKIMKKENIRQIASFDTDFDGVAGVKVIR